MLALAQHPEQWEKLQRDPLLAGKAVDEGMRYAPLPWAIPHTATRDIEYKGLRIQRDDLVFVLVPAANRDPAVVTAPDSFDITRPRVRHFAFGAGMHVCPGIRLARMEMAAALTRLVTRYDTVALVGNVEWQPGQEGRTLLRLPLLFS